MSSRNVILFLLAFVFFDAGYSFVQHFHVALDGDMAAIVLPAEWYQKVLNDPFGISILSGETHASPNRFFVHWAMSKYFLHVPLWLQTFLNPVDSVYAASALVKIVVQLLMTGILAAFINSSTHSRKRQFIIAAALMVPLFQSFGYSLQMGIIEKSITYTFFYPLPLALLMYFFLTFSRAAAKDNTTGFPWWQHPVLLCLAVALPFSGPLVGPVVLLVCPLFLWEKWRSGFSGLSGLSWTQRAIKAWGKVPGSWIIYFTIISTLSLWSLYVGSFDFENTRHSSPFLMRYVGLIKGCLSLITLKLGLPMLTAGILVNTFLITRYIPPERRQRVFRLLKWLAFFIAVYMILLPLGGYRGYRPLVIRHDTVMPVTLCLMFGYGFTAIQLLFEMEWKYRKMYAGGIIAFSLAFTMADLSGFHHNACEKQALITISQSISPIVEVPGDCPVMSWRKITNPRDSDMNISLLQHWGIAKEAKQYYSRE